MNTTPALHRDLNDEHKSAIDSRAEQYRLHRIQRERDMQHGIYYTLALLTLTAFLVWVLSSTDRGHGFCRIVSEIFK